MYIKKIRINWSQFCSGQKLSVRNFIKKFSYLRPVPKQWQATSSVYEPSCIDCIYGGTLSPRNQPMRDTVPDPDRPANPFQSCSQAIQHEFRRLSALFRLRLRQPLFFRHRIFLTKQSPRTHRSLEMKPVEKSQPNSQNSTSSRSSSPTSLANSRTAICLRL